jgi:hypothetical protein
LVVDMVVGKTNQVQLTGMADLGVQVEEVQTPLTVQVQVAQALLVKVITVDLVPEGLIGQVVVVVVPARREQIIQVPHKEVQVVSESLPQLQDRLCTMLAAVAAVAEAVADPAVTVVVVVAQAKIPAQGLLERLILVAEVAAPEIVRAVMAALV